MAQSSKSIAQITSEIFELLKDLESEERSRIISATLALFGEGVPKQNLAGSTDNSGGGVAGLGKRATLWVNQNGITQDQLSEVFHFDESGAVEIIAADVPGSNKKVKTGQVYLLLGIKNLLQSDEAKVDNQQAVELCKHLGCYDKNNHTANRKNLGNQLSGTVKDGFLLPSPGLKAAAELIKSFR